jgi:hypothetical protein
METAKEIGKAQQADSRCQKEKEARQKKGH